MVWRINQNLFINETWFFYSIYYLNLIQVVALVCNKTDLIDMEEVSYETARMYAKVIFYTHCIQNL